MLFIVRDLDLVHHRAERSASTSRRSTTLNRASRASRERSGKPDIMPTIRKPSESARRAPPLKISDELLVEVKSIMALAFSQGLALSSPQGKQTRNDAAVAIMRANKGCAAYDLVEFFKAQMWPPPTQSMIHNIRLIANTKSIVSSESAVVNAETRLAALESKLNVLMEMITPREKLETIIKDAVLKVLIPREKLETMITSLLQQTLDPKVIEERVVSVTEQATKNGMDARLNNLETRIVNRLTNVFDPTAELIKRLHMSLTS